VPDGATVCVALPFADALSARTARAFVRDAGKERAGLQEGCDCREKR
jgi:hypothetical protein